MTKIQLCFRVADVEHNTMVIEKLKEVKDKLENAGQPYKVLSCHLNKEIITGKGWDDSIINALHDTFGDKYENRCEATTFEEAMANMNEYRTKVATDVDKIFIVGEQSVGNIALEVELFTQKQIQFFN